MSPAVSIESLSFAHPGGRHQMREVSMEVQRGQVAALLGPNGAGKTTLLRCLLGLLTPHSGSTYILGEDITQLSARRRAQLLAYVPQGTATVFPFTTLDMAVMGRTPHLSPLATPSAGDRAHARGILTELGLDHLADQSFASLSGGERGLALVARALVQESEVLILDEPTAALDLGNAVRVLAVVADLARRGHTIVMTTHQPDHALRGADQVVIMDQGRVRAQGNPRTALSGELLSEVYRTPIEVAHAQVPGVEDPVPTLVPRALLHPTTAQAQTPTPDSNPYEGAHP